MTPMWFHFHPVRLYTKGCFWWEQLRRFYSDLQSEDFQSAIAMVHSRFSNQYGALLGTCTPEPYDLAQWRDQHHSRKRGCMMSREETMHSDVFGDDMEKVLPVVNVKGSQFPTLDNTLEFLYMNGMHLPQAVMVTIPEPCSITKTWIAIKRIRPLLGNHDGALDGPAAILFSDGVLFGAVLDRNGLRPSRYYVTKDGRVIFSSEEGVLDDLPTEQIIQKSRLQPERCFWLIHKSRNYTLMNRSNLIMLPDVHTGNGLIQI